MKAVYIKQFGGPENLEIRDIPDPSKPKNSQILVRVKAAGLNRADLLQRRGLYPAPSGYDQRVPGLEFAGEVEEVGEDVNDLKKGDRVFGITAGEAQAELLSIDRSLAMKMPDQISYTDAAAIPEAFITAHDALVVQANLTSGENVLIHAAGSGVGLAAIQIAKIHNAVTLGTSRTQEKLDRCNSYGLDEAILVTDKPLFADAVRKFTDGKGVDIVLDLTGAAYLDQNLRSMAVKGRIMLVGLTSGARTQFDLGVALAKRLKITGTVLRSRTTEEKSAAIRAFSNDHLEHVANGKLKPIVDNVFPAAEVAEAHKYLESNLSFGKVILSF